MSEYFTAVFKVKDKAAFAEFSKKVTGAFAGAGEIEGAEVTAVGRCDAMTESDLLREWVDAHGGDSDAILRGDD